jgi:hypothetical protein
MILVALGFNWFRAVLLKLMERSREFRSIFSARKILAGYEA